MSRWLVADRSRAAQSWWGTAVYCTPRLVAVVFAFWLGVKVAEWAFA